MYVYTYVYTRSAIWKSNFDSDLFHLKNSDWNRNSSEICRKFQISNPKNISKIFQRKSNIFQNIITFIMVYIEIPKYSISKWDVTIISKTFILKSNLQKNILIIF